MLAQHPGCLLGLAAAGTPAQAARFSEVTLPLHPHPASHPAPHPPSQGPLPHSRCTHSSPSSYSKALLSLNLIMGLICRPTALGVTQALLVTEVALLISAA